MTGARRIRVVFCLDNMGIGGTELNAVRTAEKLDRSRFDVSAVCLQEDGPLMERYAAAQIPVKTFPIRRLYGWRAFTQGIRLARFLSGNRTDIVHSHDHYSSIFATPWARLARTPVVIASRRWLAPPRHGHELATRLAYRLADRVLVNSSAVAAFLEKTARVNHSRVSIVPNFVDESAFRPIAPAVRASFERELGIPPDAAIVGIVANLSPVKDHATLLRAAALLRPRNPGLRVIVVGDGPCRQALEALAVSLGISEVVCFAGLRPNDPNLHHLFDISVLCSLSEGFPNSVIEAMAAGRPVVATDVGGTRDAVRAGETGLLVPPSDPVRLASAIERLLTQPELRISMGRLGQDGARDFYGAATVVKSLESLYEKLIMDRNGNLKGEMVYATRLA